MNDKLLHALEDCLQTLQSGAGLDSVLVRYPDLKDQLRPLLQAAQAAQVYDRTPIPQLTIRAGRTNLLAHVNEARSQRSSRKGFQPVVRFALVAALVLVFLVVGGGGLLTASARSLPDDPLYGLKRAAEVLQLDLTFDPAKKQALEDVYYQRRIDETESLLTSRRAAQVKFSGLVEAPFSDGWLVSGIRVIVTAQTEVDGEILPGMHVEVEGFTQANDTLLAQRIRPEMDDNAEDSISNPAGSDGGEATTTLQPEDGSSSSGGGSSEESGSGGTGSPTQAGSSGSNGSGDLTNTPEPTRTLEPENTPEPTKTPEPTRTPEPTK